MHSRIFQIENYPIFEDERLSSADFDCEHWFVREIADYVCDVDAREENIDMFIDDVIKPLGECAELVQESGQVYFTLHHGFREKYFVERYKRFCTILQKLSLSITLEDFASGEVGGDMYALKSAYNDRYGWWVNSEDGLYTLDDWIRHAQTETKYYLGGVLDYHF